MSRKEHRIFAKAYARLSVKADERGVAGHRRELLAGLSGSVIEIGCGNGRNFSHYPPEVASVIAVEPEPLLRELAERAASESGRNIQVVDGTAETLPASDGSMDAAVFSLVLCSVEDQSVALREAARVLRPGGELRFYEHVGADTAVLGPLLRFAQATFWPKVAGGCHPARDTGSAIAAAGFDIEHLRDFRFSISRFEPAIPHILGSARRGST